MRASLVLSLAPAFFAMSAPVFAAPSSKPKEIVVVGSKVRFHGKYYIKDVSHAYTPKESVEADAIDLSSASRPNTISIELFQKGKSLGKLDGKLDCTGSAGSLAAAPTSGRETYTLTDLGFGPTTPVSIARNGELRIGPAKGKAGGCTAIGLLVPAVQKIREAAGRTTNSQSDLGQKLQIQTSDLNDAIPTLESELQSLRAAVEAEAGNAQKSSVRRAQSVNNLKQIALATFHRAQSLKATLKQQKSGSKAAQAAEDLAKASQALATGVETFPGKPGPGDRDALAKLSALVEDVREKADYVTQQTRQITIIQEM